MGAPCNIDMNTYADDEYIIGVDFANAEIAEAEEKINEDVTVKFELKEDK
jgi:hypothetical protein